MSEKKRFYVVDMHFTRRRWLVLDREVIGTHGIAAFNTRRHARLFRDCLNGDIYTVSVKPIDYELDMIPSDTIYDPINYGVIKLGVKK